ncbi:hypothetical protein ACNPNP_15015, partial [Microbacterium sp. AGC85]
MNDLVVKIEAAVLGTPGVVALYRTGSAVTNLVGAAVERLSGSEDAATRVVITNTGGSTQVEVALGIDSQGSAVEIAQAVRDRVTALLVAAGETTPFVRLTVVHVADGRPLA